MGATTSVLPRRVTFSSEAPSLHADPNGEKYWHVLSHDPSEIEFARGANRKLAIFQGGRFAGVMREIAIESTGKQLGGRPEFANWDTGRECEAFYQRGLAGFDVGYQVVELTLVGAQPGEIPTYRVKWRPLYVEVFPLGSGQNEISVGWHLAPRAPE